MIEYQSDLVTTQQLSIYKIKTISFTYQSAKMDYETFSLSLHNLDWYLDGFVNNIPLIQKAITLYSSTFLRYIPKKNLTGSKNQ